MGGGSDTTSTQQSQSVQQLPPWINQAAQQNYGFAEQTAMQPLQQYQGQMVADVAPQTQQSWNTAASGGNAGQDQYDAAQAGYLGVMGQQPQQVRAGQLRNTDLSPYMNPYTQNVIDKTLPIMQQQLGLSQNQQQNAANSANAFGGSRQAIQQGVTQAQGAQNMAQMAAQLNQANFGQAQGAAGQDIAGRMQAALANQAAQQNQGNLNLQAAGGMGALGNAAQQNAVKNFAMQQTAGAQQQGQAQNQINAQMAKFANAVNYPNQQLSILQSALGMTPYEQGQQGSSTTETQTASNPMQMALSGMGVLSSLFPGGQMAGLGSAIGGALHAARGVTRVPGQGQRDSVPAMLTPGEAVLNRHAAAHLGRHNIAALNALAPKGPVMGALAGPAMGPQIPAGGGMPGPNLAAIAGARPPMGAMAPPVAAGGGMPGPNLGAIAAGGQGPLAAPKMVKPRRLRVALSQPRGALARG